MVIEDRTGLLGPAVADGIELAVTGKVWIVLAARPILQVRCWLWEHQAARVALVAALAMPLSGLRDITSSAPNLPVGGAALLKTLAGLQLPDDSRLDLVAATLLEHPVGLNLLQGRTISRPNLPHAILSALLEEDLLQSPSDAAVLAHVLRSELPVPEIAYPLCREYSDTLTVPYQQLVRGLLTYGRSRALVAQAVLQAQIGLHQGQVPSDPLVASFLDHAATNDLALLDAFATRLEEALLAEPEWGRGFVRKLSPRPITHPSRILPAALEADLRRQLDELVQEQRSAVDDRAWREHLFYEEYKPWQAALIRLALLVQLRQEIQQLLADEAELPHLVQSYVEHISAGDLAWMELGELATQAVPLCQEIAKLRAAYQQARTELNHAFAQGYAAVYPHLFGSGDLPLVVHLLPRVVKSHLNLGEKVLIIIVDGLGYPLWQRFRADLMAGGWQVADGYALALLPTVTAVSRYAIFSGPVTARLYPGLAEPDDDAPAEDEYKALTALLPGRAVAVYKKRDLREYLPAVVSAIQSQQHDLIVVVINEVDDAVRSVAGTPLSRQLADYPLLNAILQAARVSQRGVLLVSDHGFTPDGNRKWLAPARAEVLEARLIQANQVDEALPAVLCRDLVYDLGGPFLALYDFGGRFKAQPKVGYHSGIGLEEVVVPAAWLRVGVAAPLLVLRFMEVPEQVTEDAEMLVAVELQALVGVPGDVRVEVWLPGRAPLTFAAEPQAGLPFQRWQIPWRPTLPSKEPVEAQTVRLRAICYRDRAEVSHAEAEVIIHPRPGKYESAVASLLP
jgi:hypothetical protein